MTLNDIKQRLTLSAPTKHFQLFWCKPTGIHHGVVGDELAFRYSEWLEDSYSSLLHRPFCRKGWDGRKVPVYLFNPAKLFPAFPGPVQDVDENGPWLMFPDVSDVFVTAQSESIRGVVREVTRLFNSLERNPRNPSTAAWAWFDAVFANKVADLVHSNRSSTSAARATNKGPFDAIGSEEYARAFIDQLADTIGFDGLNRVWMEGARHPNLTPMEVLEYFGISLDFDLPMFHQQWYLRYCAKSFEDETDEDVLDLNVGASIVRHATLDSGACDWYRLKPDEHLPVVEIALQPHYTGSPLVGHVAVVNGDGQFHSVRRFEQIRTGLSARLTDIERSRHVALIISNCGARGVRHGFPHQDGQSYSLRVDVAVTLPARGA